MNLIQPKTDQISNGTIVVINPSYQLVVKTSNVLAPTVPPSVQLDGDHVVDGE